MPTAHAEGTVCRIHRESSDLLSAPETVYGLARCEARDSLERINFEQIRVFKTSFQALNILA